MLVGVCCAVVAGGCSRRQRDALGDNPSAGRDPAAVMVTEEPVVSRPVQRKVEAVGTLFGYEEVSLSAKVEGRVRTIHHDVADRVRPGELLLEIDPTDYDLTVRQAQKALAVELAKLGLTEPPGLGFEVTQVPAVVQSRVKRDNALGRLDRAQRAGAAVTPEELADKKAESQIAQAEYENQILVAKAGLATIQVKQEALAIAQQQLKDTHICAPEPTQPVLGAEGLMTYAITQRTVAEGSFTRSGTEVFKLVIDQTLKLRALVPERYAADIQLGQKAEVFAASYSEPFAGTVSRINPAVDPATRAFEVEICVPNHERKLKPGGFAKTEIWTRLDPQAVTVPLAALVHFAGITKVFLDENGRAKEVPVTLGVESTEWVEIRKPALPAGAHVLTSGQTAVADGTPVTVRNGP
jgi:RND family efflux transporter MFP subunit